MAAIQMTLVGIETREDGSSGQVTIVGMATLTGVTVGGGPVQPPDKPPQIWGGGGVGDYIDAGLPAPQPPGPIHIWGGGGVGDYIDAGLPPPQPPPNPTEPKPPPAGGGWGWHPQYGWGYFPGGGGKPQPGTPPAPPGEHRR